MISASVGVRNPKSVLAESPEANDIFVFRLEIMVQAVALLQEFRKIDYDKSNKNKSWKRNPYRRVDFIMSVVSVFVLRYRNIYNILSL